MSGIGWYYDFIKFIWTEVLSLEALFYIEQAKVQIHVYYAWTLKICRLTTATGKGNLKVRS